jgi:hypothetical protein
VSRTPRSVAAGDALAALAQVLVPYLKPLLATQQPAEPLVDVAKAVPTSRRSLYRACRGGEIDGAVRVARRWLAPRASLDAWLRARGPRLVPAAQQIEDDLEGLRALLAAGRR